MRPSIDLAVRRRDDRCRILVADHFARLQDRFQNIARAETPGQARQIRPHISAIARKVMAPIAVRRREHLPAVFEVTIFQFCLPAAEPHHPFSSLSRTAEFPRAVHAGPPCGFASSKSPSAFRSSAVVFVSAVVSQLLIEDREIIAAAKTLRLWRAIRKTGDASRASSPRSRYWSDLDDIHLRLLRRRRRRAARSPFSRPMAPANSTVSSVSIDIATAIIRRIPPVQPRNERASRRFIRRAQSIQRQFVDAQQLQPLLDREFVPIELRKGREHRRFQRMPHRVLRRIRRRRRIKIRPSRLERPRHHSHQT